LDMPPESRRPGKSPRRRRAGMVSPLIVIVMVVLLGMLVLSVDLGRTAVCRTQLQNAADAAALAGASALGTDNLLVPAGSRNQTSDIASARTLAQTFAQGNKYDLNGTSTVVLDKTNDVDVGILTSPTDLSSSFQNSGTSAFNSIRVRTRIDSTHGGNLNYLFAGVLNQVSTSLQATAVATVQLYSISTIKPRSGAYSPLLPITMPQSEWLKAISGTSGQDSYAYNATTNTITAASDGLQEVQLYPSIDSTASNHGLLQFGTNGHSDSVVKQEITSGPTYQQMTYEWPPNGVPPWNSQHQFTIDSDSGWGASNFDDLTTLMNSGQPRLIPLNDGTSPGNGNSTYTIVAFAAVRVVYVDKGGNGKGTVIVQPAVLNDPSLVAGTTPISSGRGGMPVVHLTR
jgi:Flp pilus assembly protein TadG